MVAVLGMALIVCARQAMGAAWRQAEGVKGLLQASAVLAEEEINNPFVCLREAGNADLAKEAVEKVSDRYLQGVGLCMAGETETGLAALKEAGAEVQYAGGVSASDPMSGARELARAELDGEELAAVVKRLLTNPEVEPFEAVRLLARKANDQPETWKLWREACARLEKRGEWQRALDWLEEGLGMAPKEVRGSLMMREGRVYQSMADPRDNQAALKYYDQALQEGGWIYPSEEAFTHQYRGEVYRSLKDEFNPEQALAEFETALQIQPGNYWALMDIGHVYLNDLKSLDKAEDYYRQALASNGKSPYAYYYLGEVYKARGNNEIALTWYRMALEQQADFQAALDRIKELDGK